MAIAPLALGRIAEESGFGMADVAFLAALEESTVSRLWEDADWLDRVKGRSLQALIGVIPGLGEYVLQYSLADRRTRLADELSRHDVLIDSQAFRRLVTAVRVPEQFLSNALDAASYILSGDARRAAGHLARFWGREQDYALGFLFGTNPTDCLLLDTRPLIDASHEMVEQLAGRAKSFHAIIAQANLVHHLSRSQPGAQQLDDDEGSRQTALAFRSHVMGRLIATNDTEVAAAYARHVKSSPLAAVVEDWAFPTYTHDAKPSADFSLPRSLLLRETATEVIREVATYSDAYLMYLAETSIPTIIARDSTFGLLKAELIQVLRERRDTIVLPEAARACDGILGHLIDHHDRPRGGTSFGYGW